MEGGDGGSLREKKNDRSLHVLSIYPPYRTMNGQTHTFLMYHIHFPALLQSQALLVTHKLSLTSVHSFLSLFMKYF